MAVTLNPSPTAPLPGQKCKIQLTFTGGGNYGRIWATDAPAGSSLRIVLDEAQASRVQVFEGDASAIWFFEADKPGTYHFTCQEYTRGESTTGGGYEGAPETAPSETKIGSEGTARQVVLTAVEVPMGLGEHRATLLLHVAGTTIYETFFEVHGVASPVIKDPSSSRAKIALEDATVRTKLDALINANADTACGSLDTIIDDFKTKFDAHRVLVSGGSVHGGADNTNTITTIGVAARSPDALIAAVADCRLKLYRHMRNDDGSGTINSLSPVHFPSVDRPDLKNTLVGSPSVANLAEARAGMADAHRTYELHRVQTTSPQSHTNADATNVLAALPALLQLDSAFLNAVAVASPTLPNTVNEAELALVTKAGGKVV